MAVSRFTLLAVVFLVGAVAWVVTFGTADEESRATRETPQSSSPCEETRVQESIPIEKPEVLTAASALDIEESAPHAAIKVLVLDPERTPVAGARYSLHEIFNGCCGAYRDSDPFATGSANADGFIEAEVPAHERFELVVSRRGFQEGSRRFSPIWAGLTQESELHLLEAAQLEGVVRDGAGRPIADAGISLHQTTLPVDVRTDDRGRFEIHDVIPGFTRVRVRAKGYLVAVEQVVLEPGARTAVEMQLQLGERFSGRVLYEGGGVAARVSVALSTASTATVGTETDERGNFVLEGVGPGPCKLTVQSGSMKTQIKAGSWQELPGLIALPRGADLQIQIEGVAVGSESNQLMGDITLDDPDGDDLWEYLEVGESGSVSVRDLPVGDFVARIQFSGQQEATISFRLESGRETLVTHELVPNQRTEIVTTEVSVVDPQGLPVADAMVEFEYTEKQGWESFDRVLKLRSDAHGIVQLEHARTHYAKLTVTKSGYMQVHRELEWKDSLSEPQGVVLHPESVIELHLFETDGERIFDARVWLELEAGAELTQYSGLEVAQVKKVDWHYEFNQIPPGFHTAVVKLPGGARESHGIAVGPGGRVQKTIEYQTPFPVRVHVAVNGEPASRGSVELELVEDGESNRSQWAQGEHQESGMFDVRVRFPGKYEVAYQDWSSGLNRKFLVNVSGETDLYLDADLSQLEGRVLAPREVSLEGLKLELRGRARPSTRLQADGSFLFEGLVPGFYHWTLRGAPKSVFPRGVVIVEEGTTRATLELPLARRIVVHQPEGFCGGGWRAGVEAEPGYEVKMSSNRAGELYVPTDAHRIWTYCNSDPPELSVIHLESGRDEYYAEPEVASRLRVQLPGEWKGVIDRPWGTVTSFRTDGTQVDEETHKFREDGSLRLLVLGTRCEVEVEMPGGEEYSGQVFTTAGESTELHLP